MAPIIVSFQDIREDQAIGGLVLTTLVGIAQHDLEWEQLLRAPPHFVERHVHHMHVVRQPDDGRRVGDEEKDRSLRSIRRKTARGRSNSGRSRNTG
jgi:hypothetical protein